ncbi:hypothetical protein CBS101457_002809 [Exobasidium rhododendri]|nr:hypothetical protein CBS101457_002809 [Exobasidium rhododendri]
MSSQTKLSIRPLPHLDFVLGYPGIPASQSTSRNAAHISGSIEVRLGSKGLKARWLRIELRKLESVAGGANWGELIGKGPIDVWAALPGGGKGDREADKDGNNWEVLQTADFPFRIAIPEGLPPTCKLDKQSGISYEVVSSLCVKMPKSMFRREETVSVIQSVHPIIIEKHELHSTWPIYNQPDLHSGEKGLLRAKLRRERNCYSPGDKVKVKIIVMSNRVEPAKIKSVAFSIKETVTFHGVKSSNRMALTSNAANETKPAMQHVEIVTQKAKQVGKKLYKGDSMNFDLECTIPKSHALMTISTGKHIEVSYTMRVYVDISKSPIVIDHVPMVMTTFLRLNSTEMIRKIGFVEGLSERELTIEDEDESSPQVVSRTGIAKPAPSRSASFGGSTISANGSGGGYGSYNNAPASGVRRRDTVMTNFSGPGMAGRGVPGQIFDYGSYGGGPTYEVDPTEAPRSAFAGPPSLYDHGEGALSTTERAALSHYQTESPHSALALGVDYSTIASTRGISTPPPSGAARSRFEAIPEDARSDVQSSLLQQQRQSMPATRSPQVDAAFRRQQEEEKERLYQRAQQQAERNQRKADERRAQAQIQAWAGGAADASLPPSANNSRTGTPVSRGAWNSTPTRTSNAEEEKRTLYERARREAETYQRGYTQGVSFPDERAGEGNVSQGQQRSSVQSNPNTRRSSGIYWLDSPTDELPGPRSVQAPFSTNSSPLINRPLLGPTTASALSMPTPPGAFPSAEMEKKRLFDEAKAETERHIQNQQSTSQGMISVAAGGSAPLNSNNVRRGESPPRFVSSSPPPVLSEKAQLARFQAAQDAVDRYQSQGSTINGSSFAPEQNRLQSVSSAPPTPSLITPTTAKGPGISEKEQMRLYYEAKDRQAAAEQTDFTAISSGSASAAVAAASPSISYRHSMAPNATMASPKPTYAMNYQNGVRTAWQQNSTTPVQTSTVPLQQGAFPPSNSSTGAASGQARAVSHSHTFSSPTIGSSSSGLPPLENLSFTGTDSSWAPKIASYNWADERPSSSGPSSAMPPPPLPPKTPLITSPRY